MVTVVLFMLPEGGPMVVLQLHPQVVNDGLLVVLCGFFVGQIAFIIVNVDAGDISKLFQNLGLFQPLEEYILLCF